MATMKPEKLKNTSRDLKKKNKKKESENTGEDDFEGFLSIFDKGKYSPPNLFGNIGSTEEDDDDGDGEDGDDGDDGEEDYDGEDEDEINGPGGLLEWLFGWIINPIAAIIMGIVNLVNFVIQLVMFIVNFGDCWPYYFLYFGSILFYFPINIFFMLFGLSKIEAKLFQARDAFHDFLMCLGLPITGLRNSDEIRTKCFFEPAVNRNCSSKDIDFLQKLKNLNPFQEKFQFDFVSVLTLLTTFTLVSLIIYHVVKNYLWPFLKSVFAAKKEDGLKTVN